MLFLKSLMSAVLFFSLSNLNACPVFNSQGKIQSTLNDSLFPLLAKTPICPKTVVEFRNLLASKGMNFTTTMVANRGFHNPTLGSFSFFEIPAPTNPEKSPSPLDKGDLFFGHFTAPDQLNRLTLDQNPLTNSLMIELIAWDYEREMFNFYELMGSPQGPRWIYRGNSADIWADTEFLHRDRPSPTPPFGERLRCSGCHLSGGPIMKELTEPHDSWWRLERPLPLGGRSPDLEMSKVMQSVQSPDVLAAETAKGIQRLIQGKAFQNKMSRSPQIALRPLFCEEEVNLMASKSSSGPIEVPLDSLVDRRLIRNVDSLKVSPQNYFQSLQKLHSHFPETELIDSDHAWNAPTKAFSDQLAIQELMRRQIIDEEFVSDVLAIDLTRPLFSPKRCGLLKLLPPTWSNQWYQQFIFNLKQKGSPEALELLANFTDSKRTREFHQWRAQNFLAHCQNQLLTSVGVDQLVYHLGQSRIEISNSEISQNPRGQILEPGFRIVFPEFTPAPIPWQWTLNEQCLLEL